jgi:hypothetical protein
MISQTELIDQAEKQKQIAKELRAKVEWLELYERQALADCYAAVAEKAEELAAGFQRLAEYEGGRWIRNEAR